MIGIRIIVIGEADRVLRKGALTSLPIYENIIIQKSLEFYNDPEPCMIHRGAVMKRLYMEIEEALKPCHEILYKDFPPLLTQYIDWPKGTQKITIA